MNAKFLQFNVLTTIQEFIESWASVWRFLAGLNSNEDFGCFSCVDRGQWTALDGYPGCDSGASGNSLKFLAQYRRNGLLLERSNSVMVND